jgi:ABC-type multidrug transport system fused ATPase/permease subunit
LSNRTKKSSSRGKLTTVIRSSFSILDRHGKRRFLVVSIMQVVLSFIDLLSVALVGIIASLTLRGVQSQNPGDRTLRLLEFLHLDRMTFQSQVAALAVIVIFLLVGKTFASVLITRRTLRFLAARNAYISRMLARRFLTLDLTHLQKVGVQKLQYVIGPGINGITLGILGYASSVIADASLLIVLGLGLLAINPLVALLAFIFFGAIAIIMHFALRKHARAVGETLYKSEIAANRLIAESINIYRELFTRSRRSFYADEIAELRSSGARAQAEMTFLPNLSKYIIEVALVLGAALIASVQFLTQSATVAISSLGLFLMAGSRIAPALLRLQQSFMQIEANSPAALTTIEMINEISYSASKNEDHQAHIDFTHSQFTPIIEMEKVNFSFSDTESDGKIFIKNLDLSVQAGQFVAIVGPSGSGKTTLVNLILGLYKPITGKVLLSGMEPEIAINKWPGAVSFVPQEVRILNGTISENLEFGLTSTEISHDAAIRALGESQLLDLINSFQEKSKTLLGEDGLQLSGGQKQRLGLARALYTSPKLLILDEATSALDSETEGAITESLSKLQGNVTIIVIAHRLSTVRRADRVLYVENGKIRADGTFDAVRNSVPNFDQQAKLMGL